MTEAPITMGTLISILTIVGAAGGLWWRIAAMLDASRIASEDGRRRLYDLLDQRLAKQEDTFVRRDVFTAEMKTVLHGLDELGRQVNNLAIHTNPHPAAHQPGPERR